MAQVVKRIRGHLDERQRVGLELVQRGAPRPREEEAMVYARWVEEVGPPSPMTLLVVRDTGF